MPANVYLSGPIEGISPTEATHWRQQAELGLRSDLYSCLNPMDWQGTHVTPRDYYTRDLEAIHASQLMLVNVQTEPVIETHAAGDGRQLRLGRPLYGPMRGTTWELGHAYALGIPILTVFKDEVQAQRLGPFFYEPAFKQFFDLGEAISFLNSDPLELAGVQRFTQPLSPAEPKVAYFASQIETGGI